MVMHMYDSYGHIYQGRFIAFLLKINFWNLWPQIQIIDTHFVEEVKLINMHESHDRVV